MFAGFNVLVNSKEKFYSYHESGLSICVKLDMKTLIIRINTAFKDYFATKKATILPRIYHD